MRSVACQFSDWFSPTASGENRNWPNELAAVPIPNESERQFAGKSFPNAPITTVNEPRGICTDRPATTRAPS